MSGFTTTAIMLRRVHYGDNDLIINFFTPDKGKISIIAKAAKKSTKRFGPILELFSVLQVVCRNGRRQGMMYLQEAALQQSFADIRTDVKKTAYASYWAELIDTWVEEKKTQPQLYHLFLLALEALNCGEISDEMLSVFFQLKFLNINGLSPDLRRCRECGISVEKTPHTQLIFDLVKGGLQCPECLSDATGRLTLSKGVLKQLQWLEQHDLETARRLCFSPPALQESLAFMEAFVPFHTGRQLRSLKFLRQIR
jgi:DNA repair protein RecO (recombination protein O)